MASEELERIKRKYLEELDKEYERVISQELESYARRLIDERIKSLEPIRRKLVELFKP